MSVVRISTANIPATTSKPATSPPPPAAGRATARPQSLAVESGTRNPPPQQPQIIDAEFVEFYNPDTRVFNQERTDLDLIIGSETELSATGIKRAAAATSPGLVKYQQRPQAAAPLPGSLIDILA